MKPLWAQTAAGALICAVVAALALLPGKLLGPAPHGAALALPATLPAQAVHVALPAPKPKKHPVVVHHTAPAAELAVVRTPVAAAPVVAPAPAHHVAKPKPAKATHVAPRRIRHLRVPVQPLAPKPAPAPPAAAPAATAVVAEPLEETAAPATTTTTTTATTPAAVPVPPPPPPDRGHDHGHKHGHGHDR